MSDIKIYNTEKREKVAFETLDPGKVRMYVCGPTVYDSCHIGHARPAICFDTIRRYLEYAGYAVTFISNITDIDDKIIARANELGITTRDLTQRYQDEYERDMTRLGVRSPSIRPKATEHIPEMLALIQILMDKGVAYTTDRGVWFDVSRFPEYGKLSGRINDDESTEHRVEQDDEKRNEQDFALWKASKPGEPAWESPWGPGRPGWHIECSAMSGKYCDFQLDIHGGGADLTFPHHENEIAQSEAATGKPFSRYWLHNGFITVSKDDGEEVKMGKSKGNAFWLKDIFTVFSPAAVRFWILGTHYRMPLTYNSASLLTATAGLDRIYTCLEACDRFFGSLGLAQARQGDAGAFVEMARELDASFRDAMNDDFNTPQALAVIYEMIVRINTAIRDGVEQSGVAALYITLIGHLGVLGLPLERPATGGHDVDDLMRMLIVMRAKAREEKNYSLADFIRTELSSIGFELADRDGETTWVKK